MQSRSKRLNLIGVTLFTTERRNNMALVQTNTTVGTTATLLMTLPAGIGYKAVQLCNRDAVAISFGGSAVVLATGQTLGAGLSVTVWLSGNDALYAISAAGTAANAVSVLYSGV
jgi:hypothetical protein